MHLTQSRACHTPFKNFPSMAAFIVIAILFCNAVFAKPAPILDQVSKYDLNTKDLTADDATDPVKVLAWIQENVDLEEGKAVFYSDKVVGRKMSDNFCAENEVDGYKNYWLVFNDEFSDAFGGANPEDTEIARACSQAFAQFAQGQTRVFNDAGAGPKSYWKTIELPGLNENSKVTEIWSMIDDTTDPFDFGANLKDANDGELSYVPGLCYFRVIQYQKNEPTVNPNPDYRLDITIVDQINTQIGQLLFANAPEAVGVNVDSQLPYVLIVTAGAVDSDPVSFAYAGDIWDSNGTPCIATAYASGTRHIDCSFECLPDSDPASDVKRLGR